MNKYTKNTIYRITTVLIGAVTISSAAVAQTAQNVIGATCPQRLTVGYDGLSTAISRHPNNPPRLRQLGTVFAAYFENAVDSLEHSPHYGLPYLELASQSQAPDSMPSPARPPNNNLPRPVSLVCSYLGWTTPPVEVNGNTVVDYNLGAELEIRAINWTPAQRQRLPIKSRLITQHRKQVHRYQRAGDHTGFVFYTDLRDDLSTTPGAELDVPLASRVRFLLSQEVPCRDPRTGATTTATGCRSNEFMDAATARTILIFTLGAPPRPGLGLTRWQQFVRPLGRQ